MQHESTITIKKLWPPYKAGDKRTSLEDTDGGKYRLDIITAAGFHDGDTVNIGFTDEVTSPEHGEKKYRLIKKMKHVANVAGVVPSQAPHKPSPADIGPHVGMWEKRISQLLMEFGMAVTDVHTHIILCRQLAREGVRADIDSLKPKEARDLNDSLENTF